jgi:hypothetical protein
MEHLTGLFGAGETAILCVQLFSVGVVVHLECSETQPSCPVPATPNLHGKGGCGNDSHDAMSLFQLSKCHAVPCRGCSGPDIITSLPSTARLLVCSLSCLHPLPVS